MSSLSAAGLEAHAEELMPLVSAENHRALLLPVAAFAFEAMRIAAATDGVKLLAVSGFRSVARQTEIWNRKFDGYRAQGFGEAESVEKILEYSAFPGWSRHHWGSDLDLIGSGLEGDARLEPEDWERGAVFGETASWLAKNAAAFGFRKPYDRQRSGFRPEPWHWSYAPTARVLLQRMRSIDWRAWFAADPFKGAQLQIDRVDSELRRFVFDVAPDLGSGN